MSKNKKIPIIVIIISALILGIGLYTINKNNQDWVKFKLEYEKYNNKQSKSGKTYPKVTISANNPVKYLTLKEANDLIKNKTGIIYFGYPTCPWCRNAIPQLLESVSNTSVNTIYYVNMEDERDQKELTKDKTIKTTKESSTEYQELLKNLDDILEDYILKDEDGQEYNTNEKRVYVPLVVFIKEGTIVGYHTDTVPSQTDPYKPLTKQEQEELTNIYLKNINKMLGDVCNEETHC